VSVSPEKSSQADLADSNKGVTVTITGLEKGDVISDNISFEEGETKTAEGDTYSYTIYNQSGDPAAVDPGTITFAVTVKRGDEAQEISSSFEVTKDGEDDGDGGPEAPDVDPKVSLTPARSRRATSTRTALRSPVRASPRTERSPPSAEAHSRPSQPSQSRQ